MEREWAEIVWDPEQEQWVAIQVSWKPLKGLNGFGTNAWDSYNKAVKYAEACGLEVLEPHAPGYIYPPICPDNVGGKERLEELRSRIPEGEKIQLQIIKIMY